ncbi:MAG: hypothetical protein V7637_439 [Mycobacteriales bacterium]
MATVVLAITTVLTGVVSVPAGLAFLLFGTVRVLFVWRAGVAGTSLQSWAASLYGSGPREWDGSYASVVADHARRTQRR